MKSRTLRIDADGETVALINNYHHKKSNLTVTKTFTGLDEADEAIAKAALVIAVSRPNINPTPAEGETKDVKVLGWDNDVKGDGWKSGDLNIGDNAEYPLKTWNEGK